MPKIVYITGCLGFIGSHITKKCLDLGWEVHGIDSVTYAANQERLTEFTSRRNFHWFQCDIKNLSGIGVCDVVINTAAESHVDNSISDGRPFIDSNIYGVYNLLLAIKQSPARPFLIQFSTDEVYGDILTGSHIETDMLVPSNPYSATKASADMLITAWKRTHGISATIVRPTNNYGLWQYPEKLIPCICRAVVQNKTFKLHNRGTPRRTWLHVEDTADAVIHIIQKDLRNQTYNIGGNYEDSNLNVATKVIAALTGQGDISQYCDFNLVRAGQDVRYSVNCDKLKATGWDNTKSFDVELSAIVSHYRQKFSPL